MIRGVTEHAWLDVDEFVEAFDRAWSASSVPELVDFLPPHEHPRFSDALVELMRVDLEWRWQKGCPKSLDDYQHAFPEYLNAPAFIEPLAFEEYRARRHAGERVSAEEYSRRYNISTSAWPTNIEPAQTSPHDGFASVGFVQVTSSATAPDEFPQVGSEWSGFQLLGELGRGAFSRVYLARQGDLANRLVALKVSTESCAEADKLAQLQHAHIVPIFSVHRVGVFSAVCMPYFGATTVAHLLENLRGQRTLPPSGKVLVETVLTCESPTKRICHMPNDGVATRSTAIAETRARSNCVAAPHPKCTSATPLESLAGMPYVEAILWIGVRLADGLAHAHDRGIVHRDLKPANILLANDGRPMLLDFNLSEDLKLPSDSREAFIGGTLPYMAPEQLRAFQQRTGGGDKKSDIYSLGVLLYELLSGRQPFPQRQGQMEEVLSSMFDDRRAALVPLRDINPKVSPAVNRIVHKCLAPDPNQRYQSGQHLQEDLERHLQHLPLRHVREPSLRERARKWARRHPRLTSASSMAVLALVMIAALGALLAARSEQLAELESARTLDQFHQDLRATQLLCLDAANAGREESAAVIASCRRALDRFQMLNDPKWREAAAFKQLTSHDQERLCSDAGELLFLMTAMTRLQADGTLAAGQRESQLRAALELNQRAELFYPIDQVPQAFLLQRKALAAELGPQIESHVASVGDEQSLPRSPRDESMLACLLAVQHRYRESLPHWQRASAGDPQNVWAMYGLGTCYEQLSQPSHAAACFTACISLKPDSSAWYFHRGVAYLKQQEFALASSDFDTAMRLQPDHKDTLINRALTRIGQNRHQDAVDDLLGAIQVGGEEARIYFILANARERSGDVAGAQRDRETGLRCEPKDDIAWVARGVSRITSNPSAALEDFDRALQDNPHCLAALESKAHVLAEKLVRNEDSLRVLDRALELYPEQTTTIAARRVLLARLGKQEAALADAEGALRLDASDAIRYQVAGIYALLSANSSEHRQRALALLASALRNGYGSNLIDDDAELDPVRNDPEFQKLLQAARTLQAVSP